MRRSLVGYPPFNLFLFSCSFLYTILYYVIFIFLFLILLSFFLSHHSLIPSEISGQGSIDPPPPSNNTCNVAECKVDFDDSSWRLLNVPHDFVIEGTFDPAAGIYIYRS